MNFRLTCLFILISTFTLAQEKLDSIYTHNKVITGKVKEIGHEDITYTLQDEAVIYRIYKRNLLSITFSNGRKEIFNTRASLNEVNEFKDWDKVNITSVSGEVAGMIRVATVSTKATGATVYSSVTNTQDRAFKKMKQAAALLGGNIVLLSNQSVEGNVYGQRTTRTQLTGTIFRSLPLDTTGIAKNLSNKTFVAVQQTEMKVNSAEATNIYLYQPPKFKIGAFKANYRGGILYVNLKIPGHRASEYMVTGHQPGKVILAYTRKSRFVEIILQAEKKNN